MLRRLLKHPAIKDLDIDSPEQTQLHKEIIQNKNFLKKLYHEWYTLLLSSTSPTGKPILELGSGGGFLKEFSSYKNIISSDFLQLNYIDATFNACYLPFKDNSLQSILMTNVLHHIPDVSLFFAEATRCLEKNGTVAMIEPWNSPVSRWIYKNLHHEPFKPDANWELSDYSGPLSTANDALPWIVFHRDKELFTKKFPLLKINTCLAFMPFSYLFSGGVSMRSLLPGFLYKPVRYFEKLLPQNKTAMFAYIELRKTS